MNHKTIFPFLFLLITAFSSRAQQSKEVKQDSLRKVFHGKYSYTHSYSFEHYTMSDGTDVEVVPISDEVTYYELELYRYGDFAREVSSSKEDSWTTMFHQVEFGSWRIEGDTLFLKVTEREYSEFNPLVIQNSNYSPSSGYCVSVEEPFEEKYFLVSGNYFCNSLEPQTGYSYNICYSKKAY